MDNDTSMKGCWLSDGEHVEHCPFDPDKCQMASCKHKGSANEKFNQYLKHYIGENDG